MIAALGYENGFRAAEKVFAEMATVPPSYGGMSYERLEKLDSLQLPCPTADHPGTPILHVGKFSRGGLVVDARVTDIVPEGVLFTPFHFAGGPANVLTNTVIDSTARIPELKVCACKYNS